MKTIWKYPLVPMDSQAVVLPSGAKFLSVEFKDNAPTAYALVDPEEPMVTIEVRIRGTGHPVDEALLLTHVFLGTAITHNGLLVWHVFVPQNSIYQR